MSEITLDDVRKFNEELLTLSSVGIPIELGFPDESVSLAQQIDEINLRATVQIGRGQSIEQWLINDSGLPSAYRAALETWVRSDQPPEVLHGLTTGAQGRREMAATIGFSLVQPMVLLLLAFVGFIYLCYMVAPRIEAMYAQVFRVPGGSLRFLIVARDSLMVWGIAIPFMAIVAWLYWRYKSSSFTFRWLPGSAAYFESLRRASYANQLANLVERGLGRGEALSYVGPLPVPREQFEFVNAATDYLIEASRERRVVSADDPAIQSLPSMLRWALTTEHTDESLPDVLRFTASTFRRSAKNRETAWRVWIPIVTGAVLGGAIVLFYALSVFLPFIQFLKFVAQPVEM